MTKNLIKNYYVQFESLKSLPQFEVNSNSTLIKDFFFLENFILCLPPEKPRDIAFFPINSKAQAKMVGIVGVRSRRVSAKVTCLARSYVTCGPPRDNHEGLLTI